jgi:oligoribonuclease
MATDLLVWMDLEMTGLDPERERIIEMATLITRGDLTIVAEGPELVIHQADEILAAMDAWNTKHHTASGLVDRVRSSTLDEREAERLTLEFIAAHCPARAVPLTGNSIHQDRRFLNKYMPALDAHLHYRMVDVSTIKELARRWYPEVLARMPSKKESHRALDDIRESIEELRYYRRTLFAGAVVPVAAGAALAPDQAAAAASPPAAAAASEPADDDGAAGATG